MAKISTEHLRYLLEELDTDCVYHCMNSTTKRTLSIIRFEGEIFKYISYENGEPQKRVVTNANMEVIYDQKHSVWSLDKNHCWRNWNSSKKQI